MGKTFLRSLSASAILGYSTFVAAEPIKPPIGSTTFNQLVNNILARLAPVVLVVATVAIIFVGFRYVMAAVSGNQSKIKEANKNLMYVLVGAGVIIAASLLASAVINTIHSL